MLPLRLKLNWTVCGLADLLLAACDGGGNDGPGPGTISPPPVATTPELSVQIRGTGSITSQPVGINCSNVSCTGVFVSGAVVTLTATPGAGRAFAGWGGACAGATSTCSVTMDQVRAASAEFVAAAGNSGARYEALATTASRADFARQLNAQGAKGFNYFGPNVLGGSAFNFYAKDSANTFTAEILDTPATAAAFVAQLNAQGANGFDFGAPRQRAVFTPKKAVLPRSLTRFLQLPTRQRVF